MDADEALVEIYNRDLRTFETDLEHTIRLRQDIPDDVVVVGESGIHHPDDVLRLANANIDAILVGESLMAQDDIAQGVKTLLSLVS